MDEMPRQYELIFGFVHCRGRTTYCAGYTDSKADAEAWVKNHRDGLPPKIKIPPEDPVRYCRAAWCPFKKQKPWFDMRPSQKPDEDPKNIEDKD